MPTTEFTALIFTPGKGLDLRLTSSRLTYISFGLAIAVSLLSRVTEAAKSHLLALTLLLGSGVIGGMIWGRYEKETYFGEIGGELKITDDHIIINHTEHSWEQLEAFRFKLGHAKGEPLYENSHGFSRYRGGPAYSAGIDSFIAFKKEGREYRYQLFFEEYQQQFAFARIIKRHFYLGHIALITTYEGLRLDYDEIQKLKKEKKEFLLKV